VFVAPGDATADVAVVAAGSSTFSDIEPGTGAAGTPAKCVKKREFLLRETQLVV